MPRCWQWHLATWVQLGCIDFDNLEFPARTCPLAFDDRELFPLLPLLLYSPSSELQRIVRFSGLLQSSSFPCHHNGVLPFGYHAARLKCVAFT